MSRPKKLGGNGKWCKVISLSRGRHDIISNSISLLHVFQLNWLINNDGIHVYVRIMAKLEVGAQVQYFPIVNGNS